MAWRCPLAPALPPPCPLLAPTPRRAHHPPTRLHCVTPPHPTRTPLLRAHACHGSFPFLGACSDAKKPLRVRLHLPSYTLLRTCSTRRRSNVRECAAPSPSVRRCHGTGARGACFSASCRLPSPSASPPRASSCGGQSGSISSGASGSCFPRARAGTIRCAVSVTDVTDMERFGAP